MPTVSKAALQQGVAVATKREPAAHYDAQDGIVANARRGRYEEQNQGRRGHQHDRAQPRAARTVCRPPAMSDRCMRARSRGKRRPPDRFARAN